jgi:hypothetical protein
VKAGSFGPNGPALFALGRPLDSWLRAAGLGRDFRLYYYFLASLRQQAVGGRRGQRSPRGAEGGQHGGFLQEVPAGGGGRLGGVHGGVPIGRKLGKITAQSEHTAGGTVVQAE